jgi:cytochrome c553
MAEPKKQKQKNKKQKKLNRKQVAVCRSCHHKNHKGLYEI